MELQIAPCRESRVLGVRCGSWGCGGLGRQAANWILHACNRVGERARHFCSMSNRSIEINSQDVTQDIPKTRGGSEHDVVCLPTKQRRPPTRHALVQQVAALLGSAQLRTAQLAYSLLLLAPDAWTYEVGGASHVETNLTFLFSELHFCIVQC